MSQYRRQYFPGVHKSSTGPLANFQGSLPNADSHLANPSAEDRTVNHAFQNRVSNVNTVYPSAANHAYNHTTNHVSLDRSFYQNTAAKANPANITAINQHGPYQSSNGFQQSYGQAPVPVRNIAEKRPSSNGTYVVSSPVYQTQPIFVDQLIHQNNHSNIGPRDTGRVQSIDASSAEPSTSEFLSPSTRSTQSSKIEQSSETGISSFLGVNHWQNTTPKSAEKSRTTSESLNSRRGCRRLLNNRAAASNQLFHEEEISEIFMIPDRPPFEVPKVEHPKVLKIQMLDKLRERRARDSLFSTSGQEEDIPIKIKSDFEPKKLEFDQTNDHNMVDVNKLKNNLDQVYSRLQELTHYVDLN